MASQVLDLKVKLNAGDVIDDKYRVVRKLGEGGCGSVFHCQLVRKPEVLVAVKLLENPNDQARFDREIEVLRSVESPWVVGYRGTGKHLQFPYLAMEYLTGGSLRAYMDKRTVLEPAEAAWIAIMVIYGLRDCKTVHRDLKPENLLVTRNSAGKVAFVVGNPRKSSLVKIADFGLAKAFDLKRTRLTLTGQIMGTPLYMSPEQCQNTHNVTGKSDIYALGIILYEMVTGQTPFSADDPYTLIKMHNETEVRYPRTIDQRMEAVLRRCLQKKPEKRYATLANLQEDLERIAGIRPGSGYQRPPPVPGAGDKGLSEAARWLLVGSGMLVFTALAWLVHEQILTAVRNWWDPPPNQIAPKTPQSR